MNQQNKPSPHPDQMDLESPDDPHPALSRHPLPLPRARDILPSHRMGAEREQQENASRNSETNRLATGSWIVN